MYKRKPIKITALLLTLCLLMTAFSGTAIQAQAEELGTNAVAVTSSNTYTFYYKHYYDAASFTAAKRQYINSAVSFANATIGAAMSDQDLTVTLSTYQNFVQPDTITPMEDCLLETNDACARQLGCGSDALHHKDTKRISQYMYNNRTEAANYFRTIWCDRYLGVFCQYHNNVHQYYRVYGVVYDARPVLQIMTIGSTTRMETYMSLLLTHETVHCLTFPDVYDAGAHFDNNVYACIMDYFDILEYSDEYCNRLYNSWKNGTNFAFCDDCRAGIATALVDSFPDI